MPNPKSGLNAVTLRSGNELEGKKSDQKEQSEENPGKDHVASPQFPYAHLTGISENSKESAYLNTPESTCMVVPDPISDSSEPPLPFPEQLKKPKKSTELDPELLEIFSKVELTIPLIDAIQ